MEILTANALLDRDTNFKKGWGLVIEDGRILEVGLQEKLLKGHPEIKPQDYPDCLIMPGLINAHTQLELLNYERPKSAGTDTPPFVSWLIETWEYRKRLTPAARRGQLLEGIDRLLRSGTTCVGDTGNYVGVLSSIPKRGLRMVLYPEIFTSAEKSVQTDYEGALTLMDEIIAMDSPRIRPGMAPYAAYTVSTPLLKILGQNTARIGAELKIHAAESFAEMQFFYESGGEIAEQLFPALGWGELPPPHRKTPIGYLNSIGLLQKKPALVGGIHLADEDIRLMAQEGAKVILTPRLHASLKLGIPPIKKLLAAGIPVGLGTDGIGSFSISLWDEMRFVLNREPEYGLTAKSLLQRTTLDAARTLGLDKKIGSLESGKQADLILVCLPKKTGNDPLRSLIEETNEPQIKAVFIDGEKIKTQ